MKLHKYRVHGLISKGLGPAVVAIPGGQFTARDLPVPGGAGNRFMQTLRQEGIIQRVATVSSRGHTTTWERGPTYTAWRDAIEAVM